MSEDFFRMLESRRSVRRFETRRPDREVIERLVAAACSAPSNRNRQGWKFVVFQNPLEIASLAEKVRATAATAIANAHPLTTEYAESLPRHAAGFDQAPTLILVMHKKNLAAERAFSSPTLNALATGEALSAAMAAQNLILAAHALGLGACVMTAPLLMGDVWKNVPDLPLGYEPTCLIALGYPAEKPEPPPRKKLHHVLEFRDGHE